jgi:peptidoglycan/LPS O-acetylase OafA/YrhL
VTGTPPASSVTPARDSRDILRGDATRPRPGRRTTRRSPRRESSRAWRHCGACSLNVRQIPLIGPIISRNGALPSGVQATVAIAPAAVATQRSSTIVFLETLRAVAALLVVYDHQVGQWADEHQRVFRPAVTVTRYVEGPLVITQHFGWLGVALFFLISGFIISHVAANETRFEFVAKRALRIYPPLVLAVIIAVADLTVRRAINLPYIPGQPLPAQHSVGDVLASMTLVNYVMVPQPVVLGVAWSLVIEVIFYILIFLLLGLLRRHAALVPLLILVFTAACLHTLRSYGSSWFLFTVSVSYLPLLVLGQVLWLFWTKRCSLTVMMLLSGLAWFVWIRGVEHIYPQFLVPGASSYGPSVLLGYCLFAGGLAVEQRLQRRSAPRWFAERSYSLYLLHGTIGILALDLLSKVMTLWLAIPIAIGVSCVAASLSYRWVERPSQRFARRLVRKPRSGGAARDVSQRPA